jgi:hypothetical protein
MLQQVRQTRRDVFGREHEIHRSAGNRTLRHAGVLRRLLLLREGEAAGRFDLAYPERAVRARPRQDDANGMRPLDRGERTQKVIDGVMRTTVVRAGRDRQDAVGNGEVGVRLNDVDVVRRDLHAVHRVDHRHGGVGPQQFTQPALIVRIEMLDDDEGKAGLRRQGGDQLRQRAQPAG